jgi:hypothetical protein
LTASMCSSTLHLGAARPHVSMARGMKRACVQFLRRGTCCTWLSGRRGRRFANCICVCLYSFNGNSSILDRGPSARTPHLLSRRVCVNMLAAECGLGDCPKRLESLFLAGGKGEAPSWLAMPMQWPPSTVWPHAPRQRCTMVGSRATDQCSQQRDINFF